MNKHGQTLILFVILIPIMLIVAAFIIDTGLVIENKTHLKEVSKTIINENIDDADEVKIINLFKKNKIDINNLKIDIKDNYIGIKNEYEVDSIFGSIIGIKKYKVKIDIKGRKENEKVIFE